MSDVKTLKEATGAPEIKNTIRLRSKSEQGFM